MGAKSPELPHLVGGRGEPLESLAQRTTQHKSEGVQEDDKTSSVPSIETSPEHSRAWLTQNLGLPTEEEST
ncbi:hypothetical protein Taro_019739 [Colocasia esculenta]|uniref:Uncharacterized protein n=1 Tax=Colocasia esculenta TaxID=4460 RepID=A0A843UX19_COLES|nr:hypothetical protein [Colocasia esculenta]